MLDLSGNFLVGPIPPEIGMLRNLWSLQLNDNRLTGPVPHEICLLTKLTVLWIDHNALTGRNPTNRLRKALPLLVKLQL